MANQPQILEVNLTKNISEGLVKKVLTQSIPDWYCPQDTVLAMAVGCGIYREGSLIRDFHLEKYNISPQQVGVIGCDVIGLREADYDAAFYGFLFGDAASPAPWSQGLKMARVMTQHEQNYDFILLSRPQPPINPRIIDMALSYLSPDGTIAIVVSDLDDSLEEKKALEGTINSLPSYLTSGRRLRVTPIEAFSLVDQGTPWGIYSAVYLSRAD